MEREEQKGETETVGGGDPPKSQKPCERCWEVESRKEKRKEKKKTVGRRDPETAETWRAEHSVPGGVAEQAGSCLDGRLCLDRLHPWAWL